MSRLSTMVDLERPPEVWYNRRAFAPRIIVRRSAPFLIKGDRCMVHRPRYVYVVGMHKPGYVCEYGLKESPHMAGQCWCGTGILSWHRLSHDFPAGAVMCATCEGRAIGAGQLDTVTISGRPVKFSPRR